MKYFFGLLAFVLFTSCSTSKIPVKYSQIEYSAGACFGFCPIFKMTIDSDRTAIFEAERFNFSQDTSSEKKEGTFKGKINETEYHQLIRMLDSLQPKNLKDYYGNKNISDLPTSYLTVTYQDGSVKTIQDYGKHGTEELEKLYQLFEDLKTNQTWTKNE